jgi:hypothetical protein
MDTKRKRMLEEATGALLGKSEYSYRREPLIWGRPL